MLDKITKAISKIFGTKSERDLKEIMPIVNQIKEEYTKLSNITDEELRQKTKDFIARIEQELSEIDAQITETNEKAENPAASASEKDALFKQVDKLKEQRNTRLEEVLNDILPEAFAVVKETARRLTENKKLTVNATMYDEQMAAKCPNVTIEGDKAVWSNKWLAAGSEVEWNMVHYDVQLFGGVVLHQGKIAEMMTGEGKTLVSTLPAYLNALAKRGVHIVTVNDYLAMRDSEWNAPLFEFHELSVDCIDKHQPHSPQRIAAYNSDIIYGTNNEFGFDYLRDNMSRNRKELVQRDHHFAVVDEVDSVLIDDARTPLIISGPVPRGDQHEFFELKPMVAKLVEEQRKLVQGFLTDAKKQIAAGESKEGGLALLRAHRGLPKNKPLIKYLSEVGHKQILQKTENIYMADNNRLMPEADKPLLFKIEEKNNTVDLTEKGLDVITGGNDKNFFVLPDLGTEMDLIEKDPQMSDEEKVEAKDKLIADYEIKTQRIHTVQQLLKSYTLFEKDVDYIVVEGKVMIVDEQTGRVMEGRRYSDGLHQALEAKENVKIEAATQTYATVTLQNYFRMYHKLAGMTGTAETEAGEFWQIYELDVVTIPTNRPIARQDMQDKVYKTVREKFNAVAEEIQHMVQQGRPILVGTTSVENSEVLSRMLKMRRIEHQVLNAKHHAMEAEIVAKAGQPGTVTIATNMAGRGTDIKLSDEVKNAGGLAIIGTERHESRRVDRQLRGRAGRQGDPGSSQFYVSLEDNLMRLFGSDRIASVMDRLGLEEGEVIQHSMITKSIERAQKKVEENNFAIRKRLLEYDDVMNYQREVIYRRRRNALFGERLQLDIMNSFFDAAQFIAETHQGNFEGFKLDALKALAVHTKISENDFHKMNEEEITVALYKEAIDQYRAKNKALTEKVLPVFKQLFEERGAVVENIAVPVTDGRHMMQITANLKDVVETEGEALVKTLEQNITLAVIDQEWKEHLREMDELKQQVQNAVHEQKDPLLIFKFESFELFKSFLNQVNEDCVSFLSKANIAVQEKPPVPVTNAVPEPAEKVTAEKAEVHSSLETPKAHDPSEAAVEVTKPISSEKEYGRNDRVTVKYSDGTVKEDVKFKSVEQDVKNNKCIIVKS
ncbi:preprotein translocase subunit SecA [Limibacter armeniacum]|uniref:preprotein translocase subunit SecA n=1 Tax=Limibacter armeniacum TaxID=466084 RepID=UPI002FE5FC42